jgi:hypothetical protein
MRKVLECVREGREGSDTLLKIFLWIGRDTKHSTNFWIMRSLDSRIVRAWFYSRCSSTLADWFKLNKNARMFGSVLNKINFCGAWPDLWGLCLWFSFLSPLYTAIVLFPRSFHLFRHWSAIYFSHSFIYYPLYPLILR